MTSVKIKLNPAEVAKLREACASFNNEAGELINVLHKAQSIFGYLPAEVQEVVAEELNIAVANFNIRRVFKYEFKWFNFQKCLTNNANISISILQI